MLASLLVGQRRAAEAIAVLERCVGLLPDDDSVLLNMLGVLLADAGQTERALEVFGRVARIDPAYSEVHNNIGVTFEALGRLDEAEASYRRAILLKPDYAEAHNNLGNALRKQRRHFEAVGQHRRAIQLKPSHVAAYHNLANTLDELARPEEALPLRQELLRRMPADAQLHSDLLWSSLCVPDVSPRERFQMHVDWGERHAKPLYANRRLHDSDRTNDRPLRVGYVSPNFGAQAIGWFILPLLSSHDRGQVVVPCYNDTPTCDWMTERIRAAADHWRHTAALDFQQLAQAVREDEIDVLVDLRGHMAGHRLLTFALKPAPVQVSYLGYQYTVGFDAIDYRICDSGTDPDGTERFHVERLLRLPRTIWCYGPQEVGDPSSSLPAARNGFVTFGVFQKPAKLNGFTVELWCRILLRVPRSRLMVLCPGPDTLHPLRTTFAERGVDPQRVVATYQARRDDYLRMHQDVDIALDTFPYSGITTTCDAMWMGVPVVSLLGPEPFERGGASLLPPCGLQGFVAEHPTLYEAVAVRWAEDLGALAEARRDLRERMRASPLMQARPLSQAIEHAYRAAWSAREH